MVDQIEKIMNVVLVEIVGKKMYLWMTIGDYLRKIGAIFNKNIFLTLWLSIFFFKAILFSPHSKLNNLLPCVKLCFQ